MLATDNLTVGSYTQIRMSVPAVEVVFHGGQKEKAEIPIGKLRFVQPFDVVAGQATVLLFDFDAATSVIVTGNGKVLFKPVIKLSVTKTPGALQITTPSLPDGTKNVANNAKVEVIGWAAPYTFSLDSGSLPSGLTLNTTTGAISGTPTAKGAFTFKVKVTSSPNNDTQSLTISIDDEVAT